MKLLQTLFQLRGQKNDQQSNVLSMDEMNAIVGGQPETALPDGYWWVEEA